MQIKYNNSRQYTLLRLKYAIIYIDLTLHFRENSHKRKGRKLQVIIICFSLTFLSVGMRITTGPVLWSRVGPS